MTRFGGLLGTLDTKKTCAEQPIVVEKPIGMGTNLCFAPITPSCAEKDRQQLAI